MKQINTLKGGWVLFSLNMYKNKLTSVWCTESDHLSIYKKKNKRGLLSFPAENKFKLSILWGILVPQETTDFFREKVKEAKGVGMLWILPDRSQQPF